MSSTETLSNGSSPNGFDFSPFTPPDASATVDEEKDLKDDPPQGNMKLVEEENLLKCFSEEESKESVEGLSKSQRLEFYNQVALDPESSDDDENDEEDETLATEEKESDSSSDDASSEQEYNCLQQENEEDDYNVDDILHDGVKRESYFDSSFAASLVSSNFEQFDMNAFHSATIEEEKFNVIEQDTTDILFQSSDFIVEETSKGSSSEQQEEKDHDPMKKFAKSIPLLKPPPPEKLEAYLRSKNKKC